MAWDEEAVSGRAAYGVGSGTGLIPGGGKVKVKGDGHGGGGGGGTGTVIFSWGEPRLTRRVLPGADGAIRSLAAAGQWLFVASDQKVVLPSASAPINAAFAASASASSSRSGGFGVTTTACRGGGGGGGDVDDQARVSSVLGGNGNGNAKVTGIAADDGEGMVHIRAMPPSSSTGGDGGVPRSLILPEVQAARDAAAMAYTTSAGGTFNIDSFAPGGGDGVEKPNFASLHAISLRREGGGGGGGGGVMCTGYTTGKHTGGGYRRGVGGGSALDDDDDGVEVRAVALPPSITRPDVLFADNGGGGGGGEAGGGGPVAVVGTTVAAPVFVAVVLNDGRSSYTDVQRGGGAGYPPTEEEKGRGGGGRRVEESFTSLAVGPEGMRVLGTSSLGDALGSMMDRPVRVRAAATWPFGSSHAAGWLMTCQSTTRTGTGTNRSGGGMASFTSTSLGGGGAAGTSNLALSHFSVGLPGGRGRGSAVNCG